MNGPTQKCGQTQDVLSYSKSVPNLEIFDHMPVLFNFLPFGHSAIPFASAWHYRAINPFIAAQFIAAFNCDGTLQPLVFFNTEELALLFYSTCQTVLDWWHHLKSDNQSPDQSHG